MSISPFITPYVIPSNGRRQPPGTQGHGCIKPLARTWMAALGLLGLAGCTTTDPSPSGASLGASHIQASTVSRSIPGLPEPSRIPTRVGELAVRDTGPRAAGGEIIVLWPSILADHRIYRAQIEAWRDRHRLIVIDGPGHGASGPAPGTFSMADCAAALASVLQARNVQAPVVIVGTSWGGLVGGEFALAHPQSTRAVVMLNTPLLTAPGGPGFSELFVTWGARWMHDLAIYRDGVARSFFLPTTRQRGGQSMEDFHEHLSKANGAALATAVRAVLIEREPLAPKMSRIQAPVLLIAGSQDALYPIEDLRRAASVLPRGRFEVVDSAHISVVDSPDQSTRLIEAFLAKLP